MATPSYTPEEILSDLLKLPALGPIIIAEVKAIDAEFDAIAAVPKAERKPSLYLNNSAASLEHAAKILRAAAPLADSVVANIKD